MKIGVKKVITNFWNREQVEPKPMSPPKIHFSGYKNTNDNLTKSLLMDFFTDFEGTIFREIRLLRRRNSTSWKQNLMCQVKWKQKEIFAEKIRTFEVLKHLTQSRELSVIHVCQREVNITCRYLNVRITE